MVSTEPMSTPRVACPTNRSRGALDTSRANTTFCWILRAQWPAAAVPGLQALQAHERRQRSRRRLGWSALALIALSPLLLVGLFWLQADRLAAWLAEQVPIAEETRLGRTTFAAMRGELSLIDEGPTYAALATLGQRLTAGSRYTYEFHVVADPTLNAFALPGGVVVVNTGLIAATSSAEELAGVLAHEVQHVELRHGTQTLIKGLGWQAVWMFATGDFSNTLAGQAARQLGRLKFSRDAERAADKQGFEALVRAGINPAGMPRFFATLARQDGTGAAPFLSTHPSSQDRQAALESMLAGLNGRPFSALALAPWPPTASHADQLQQ